MILYKNATRLMTLTFALLVGLGSIEGAANEQQPNGKRRRGLGKSSLRSRRRAEAPAEDTAHTVIEMGEDSLVIEIAYTDGTEESILLPHFFDELYKTPCHYTYQNCNCCGILPHKTLDDIEVATIYTYNTETHEYLPHPEFTEKFAAVLDEVKKDFRSSLELYASGGALTMLVRSILLHYSDGRGLESVLKRARDYLLDENRQGRDIVLAAGQAIGIYSTICAHCSYTLCCIRRIKNGYLAQFQPDFSEEEQ